jgi:predicted aspartyl protease
MSRQAWGRKAYLTPGSALVTRSLNLWYTWGKEYDMGEVRTEITLVNIGDKEVAERGYLPQEEVRRLTVNAVVDTGAGTLVIDQKTREKLGLRVEETVEVALAGGGKAPGGMTEYLEVRWKDRHFPCAALVLPGEKGVTLGRYPLFGLNVTVNPQQAVK